MQYTSRPSELYIETAAPADTDRERTHTLHGWHIREASETHGRIHSLTAGDVTELPPAARMSLSRAAGEIFQSYLGDARRLLVCGLGSERMAADRLGPTVCSKLGLCGRLPGGRELYSFVPGVTAATGIPTDTLVRLAAEAVQADRILVVDALCARCASNLAAVVQWTDTGLTPGSGASEASEGHPAIDTVREAYPPEISTRTMPCPVVTAGVPTVIRTTLPTEDAPQSAGRSYLVTPGTIDRAVECWSSILSAAILRAVMYPAPR